jgi:hypothetical protein
MKENEIFFVEEGEGEKDIFNSCQKKLCIRQKKVILYY